MPLRHLPKTDARLPPLPAGNRRKRRMIRTGDSIANPVTGETVTFQRTSADSGGELVIAEVTLEPGGSAAGVHVHPNQTETFQILDGTVGFRLGRERLFATTGETVVVRPAPRTRSGTPAKAGPGSCARYDPRWGSSACWRRCSRLPGTARPTAGAYHTRFAWPRSPTTTATTFNSPSSPSRSSDWRPGSAQPRHGRWPSSAPPTTAHSRVAGAGAARPLATLRTIYPQRTAS